MIALRVGTEFLDLQDARIRIRMESPLFSSDIIAPAYSYPISLPRTPTNTRLLNHADHITRTEKSATTNCVVYLGGLPWREAVINFRRFRNGRFDVDLAISRNIDILRFADRRLRSLALGSFSIYVPYEGDTEAQVNDLNTLFTSHTYPPSSTQAVYAPFWDDNQIAGHRNFFGGPEDYDLVEVTRPGGLVNKYRGSSEATQPWMYYTELDPVITYWVHLMVPMPYLSRTVRTLFTSFGYVLESDILDDEEVANMVIFGNATHSFYISTDPGVAGYGFNYLTPVDMTEWEVAWSMPDQSLIQFMLALQKRFNGRFLLDDSTRIRFVSLKSVLRSATKRDISALVDTDPDFDTDQQDGYTFKAQEDKLEGREDGALDPVITATFAYTVNSVADLSGILTDDGDLALVLNSDEVYRSKDGFWIKKGDYTPEVKVDAGGTEVDVGVVLTRMAYYRRTEDPGDAMLVPRIEVPLDPVRLDAHNIGVHTDEALRLLFFRGMQNYTLGGDQYPLLTTGIHDAQGNVIDGATQTERVEGEGGILDTWYTEWLDFLADTRTAKKRVRLGPEILNSFQWDEKLHAHGVDYLVKSIDVEFTDSGMGVPTLYMVRVPALNA